MNYYVEKQIGSTRYLVELIACSCNDIVWEVLEPSCMAGHRICGPHVPYFANPLDNGYSLSGTNHQDRVLQPKALHYLRQDLEILEGNRIFIQRNAPRLQAFFQNPDHIPEKSPRIERLEEKIEQGKQVRRELHAVRRSMTPRSYQILSQEIGRYIREQEKRRFGEISRRKRGLEEAREAEVIPRGITRDLVLRELGGEWAR